MPLAVNDGLRLYYESGGPPDAETVVFVEGFASGRWMWRWQEPTLSRSFETLLWDNRGTGRSDEPDVPATPTGLAVRQATRLWTGFLSLAAPPLAPFAGGSVPEGPPTMSDLAADLEAVLAAHGVESAHIIGASMGGMIAQQYAIEYDRAKTLTLLCTTPGGPDAANTPRNVRNKIFNASAGHTRREEIRQRMTPVLSSQFRESNPELVERIVDWRLDGDASRRGELAQACAVAGFDASDRIADIDLPTLVAHGTADRVVPVENARLLADRLPDAELALVEDGSHLFFVERADAVNRQLLEFLRNHTNGSQ
jgi:pimeloyl-ACP methyl ester carboxylesterase